MRRLSLHNIAYRMADNQLREREARGLVRLQRKMLLSENKNVRKQKSMPRL